MTKESRDEILRYLFWFVMGIAFGVLLGAMFLSPVHSQEKVYIQQNITDTFKDMLYSFCSDKLGISAHGSFSPAYDMVYIYCLEEKDGWTKSGMFTRNDWERWLENERR